MFDFGTMALLYLISIPIIGAAVPVFNAAVNTIVNRVKAAIPPKGYKTIGPSQVQEKDKRSKNNKTIIGVKNTSDTKGDGLRIIDFLSYNDRALCYWYNSSGSSLQAYDFGIRGQLVYRLSGMNSMIWEWSNYGDIDINGENEIRISNNFIVSQAQAEDVGDFARKELSPHNMYQLMVYGCHPYMEIGDIYRLQIDYTMPSWNSQIELIDVDVEIRGVRMHRECGQIGASQLIVRVPSGEWTKTTSMRARKILAGLPYDILNRGNEISVGAYDYTGQATYYCDGVDDDVQIQEAIDVLAARGGGTIRLYSGEYRCNTITMKDNIEIVGSGKSTVLYPMDNTVILLIDWDVALDSRISNFVIDGDRNNLTMTLANATEIIIDGQGNGKCDNIQIRNYSFSDSNGYTIILFYDMIEVFGCSFSYARLGSSYTLSTIIGFAKCKNAVSCSSYNNDSTNIHSRMWIFDDCGNITSSLIYNNTGYDITAIIYSKNISSCSISSNTITSLTCFASCSNVSACDCIDNTATNYTGYHTVKNITGCLSANNSGSSNERGFLYCRSVQQCKTDDTIKYGTGTTQSYAASSATAGTECADTPNGGFNS